MLKTLDAHKIDLLRNVEDLLPVTHLYFEDWNIRVVSRQSDPCKNYLSPNRRDFYKILYISKGEGVVTIGTQTYYIDKPTIVFLHPNGIISWRNFSDHSDGYYMLFKKRYMEKQPILKAAMDKYELFQKPERNVIRLEEEHLQIFDARFEEMMQEINDPDELTDDRLQTYMQLLMIESVKVANFPKPDMVTEEYRHVHDFFQLLETEMAQINVHNPIKIKTAKEFAHSLSIHPNHLNALLKKHTGQNVSTHIKNRLLEESKVLLIQTEWSLQEIGYSIGFADQPNFNQFFKKNSGITPQNFRRSYQGTQQQQ